MARPKKPVGRVRRARIAQELRDYHQRGREILAHEGKKDIANEELMERYGVSPDQYFKTWAFAKYYTEDELEELCAAEPPLHWSHVRELLVFGGTSDGKDKRANLQADAIKYGWTVNQLREAIQKVRRKTSRRRAAMKSGGRPFKYESVSNVLRWAGQTQRYLNGLVEGSEDAESPEPHEVLLTRNASASEHRNQLRQLAEVAEQISHLAATLKAHADAAAGAVTKPRRRKSKR